MISFDVTDPIIIGFVVAGFLLAFIVGFGIGANDVSNSFGSSYGAKLLTFTQIIILAGTFEFLGAVILGNEVSDTIRKKIVSLEDFQWGYNFSTDCRRPVFNETIISSSSGSSNNSSVAINCAEMIQTIGSVSALAGTGIWLLIANFVKLPVSATHSIVGATLGYGLVALEGKGINWTQLLKIVGSWALSPVASGVSSAFVCFTLDTFVTFKTNGVKNALLMSPFVYFLTIFVLLFSIFFDGSKLLKFDEIPLYGVFIITIGGALISAIAFKLFIDYQLKRNWQCYLYNAKSEVLHAPVNSLVTESSKSPTNQTTDPVFEENNLEKETECKEMVINEQETGNNETSSKYHENHIVRKIFAPLQIMCACNKSFAHGGNDVSNAVAPLMSIWLLYTVGSIADRSTPPIWILIYGACSMLLGLAIWGARVLKTVGDKLTEITTISGVSVEFASSVTVLIMTRFGVPISTTHCQVGSVVAVGWLRYGFNSIDRKLIYSILLCWVLTVPIPGILSAIIFTLTRLAIFGT